MAAGWPPTRPGTCVLVIEDDAAFAMTVGAALETAGLHPYVIAGIDEQFIPLVTATRPAAVIVDLLVPTAEALRLGRWIARVCPVSVLVLVVVPGTTNPALPDVMTDRLRMIRRPIVPDRLAQSLGGLVRPLVE